MNWAWITGNWKQFQGQVQGEVGQVADDDLTTIAAKEHQFVGKLQERYGY